MKGALKNLRMAFSEVFANTSYMALAGAIAIIALLFAVWLPNLGLMNRILATSSAPFEDTAKVAISLLGGIRTNFSWFSASYTIAIAALFGVNIAMVAYVLKRQRALLTRKERTVGFGGMASGALGIGCAFCGSFLLSAALSFFGAAGAIAFLPLRGGEFGIVSVILLTLSLFLISRKIAATLTCNTKPLCTTN